MKKKIMLLGVAIGIAGWCVAGNASKNASKKAAAKTIDVRGGFIYNHGAVNPDDVGLTFTNAGIRDITISAGQLSGVDPETGVVITNSANLLPLKAQSFETTGDVTAGGFFVGDGSKLTGLSVTNLVGDIDQSQVNGLANALLGKVDSFALAPIATSGDYNSLSNVPALASVAMSGNYADLTNAPVLQPIATNATFANLSVTNGAIAQAQVNGLTNALLGKVDSFALAPIATSGDFNSLSNVPALASVAMSGSYADLINAPVLQPIATNATFANLSVTNGAIAQAQVNGLINALAGKVNTTHLGTMAYASTSDYLTTAGAENFVEKNAATNVLSGELIAQANLTVQGQFVATYIPPQGDLLMGSYTNGLPQ